MKGVNLSALLQVFDHEKVIVVCKRKGCGVLIGMLKFLRWKINKKAILMESEFKLSQIPPRSILNRTQS